MPTLAEIDAARTPAGGWTREQLARWGVAWPPPKGWKAKLAETVEREIDAATKERAEAVAEYTDAEFKLKAANRRLGAALVARERCRERCRR